MGNRKSSTGIRPNESLQDRLERRTHELKTQTYALYLAYRDSRTPWYAKAWTALVVAYAISPIDLIPDFILVLGYLDDLIIVPAGIALALKLVPPDVMAQAQENARQATSPEGRGGWIAAVVIIMIWLLIFGAIAWLVLFLIRIYYHT